jgi:hypothetical protein
MEWVVNAMPWLLYPGKDSVPIVEEDEWAPGLVWMGAENLAPTRIRSPDRPVHSESLYRLHYPGQHTQSQHVTFIEASPPTWGVQVVRSPNFFSGMAVGRNVKVVGDDVAVL